MYMQEMTRKWQTREIDNFTYLMHLNIVADRTVNDLTQYPVMPWVICDYTSEKLNLDDPKVFRDLSKPIGALNEKRLAQLRTRYEQMPTGLGCPPKFIYGTHYSTPGYVLNYLVRVKPDYMLCLQNGRFDHADRIFANISATWQSVMQNTSDVKELIPEFYEGKGEFLVNARHLDLGTRQNGRKVDNVELPPWASSPEDFVKKCRAALESDFVSANIHHWIDLIFGYKQRGKEAENANNVFYYMTYEGAVDVDSISDPVERKSIALQIREFGQTPKQLFHRPHPLRDGSSGPSATKDSEASSMNPFAITKPRATNPFSVPSSKSEDTTTRAPPPQYEAATKRTGIPDDGRVVEAVTSMSTTVPLKLSAHLKSVTGVCISRGGSHPPNLLSTSEDAGIGLYDVRTSNRVETSRGVSKLALSACAWTHIPRTAVASSWDGSLYLWSADSKTTLHEIAAHEDAVSCMTMHRGRIVSGSWDSTVKLFDVERAVGRRDATESSSTGGSLICRHDTEVSCLSSEGPHSSFTVLSGSCDGQIFVNDLRTKPKAIASAEIGVASVTSLQFVAGGRYFLASGADGVMRVLTTDTCEIVSQVATGDEEIRCACVAGSSVFTAGSGGVVRVWDLSSASKPLMRLCFGNGSAKKPISPITALCCSYDGAILYAGCESGEAYLWKS